VTLQLSVKVDRVISRTELFAISISNTTTALCMNATSASRWSATATCSVSTEIGPIRLESRQYANQVSWFTAHRVAASYAKFSVTSIFEFCVRPLYLCYSLLFQVMSETKLNWIEQTQVRNSFVQLMLFGKTQKIQLGVGLWIREKLVSRPSVFSFRWLYCTYFVFTYVCLQINSLPFISRIKSLSSRLLMKARLLLL